MHVFEVANVGVALPTVLRALSQQTQQRDSRNGPVFAFPGPVTTVYSHPTQRVLFWPQREANPFFHLMESLWMLAGRRDVEYLTRFVKGMGAYSDDGRHFHAAYGYRWRKHFKKDQLTVIVERLRANPEDRRSVLQIWDASVDLGTESKDLPCNMIVSFQRNASGALDMTVFNRSNDIVWGAYGANAVHFSILQEYIASSIGCAVGTYWQVSANFHAYLSTYEKVREIAESNEPDPYLRGEVEPYPIMCTTQRVWDQDLAMFLAEPGTVGLREPFFRRVAVPMYMAHAAYKKEKGTEGCDAALEIIQQCHATDWRRAGTEWLERRRAERVIKKGTQADA